MHAYLLWKHREERLTKTKVLDPALTKVGRKQSHKLHQHTRDIQRRAQLLVTSPVRILWACDAPPAPLFGTLVLNRGTVCAGQRLWPGYTEIVPRKRNSVEHG